MTGAYIRIKQGNRYVNIEIEHLTDDERRIFFSNRPHVEVINWMNMLCHFITKHDQPNEQ